MIIGNPQRKTHLKIGRFGEDSAVRLLELKNYTILARNFRLKSGELDIVALDGNTIVFIEVKTIRHHNQFTPAGNLSFRQLKRNRTTGRLYMAIFGIPGARCRYDLIEITVDRRRWRKILKITHSTDILSLK